MLDACHRRAGALIAGLTIVTLTLAVFWLTQSSRPVACCADEPTAEDLADDESTSSESTSNDSTVDDSKSDAASDKPETDTPAVRDSATSEENSVSLADSDTFDLRYKFKPGEIVRWEVIHRAAVDTTIQGANQTAETRSISVKSWKITDVAADGRITFIHSVESIDMWQKMQGRQEVRFNSLTDKGKPVPAGYEEVAKAVGIPLTEIAIDRRGKVLERNEKYQQANMNASPITIPLPAEAVPVGYTWSAPLDVEVILHGGGSKKIATRQQFTLEKVVDGLASIQVDTQVLTPIKDPAIEAQLIQRMTSGTLKFDIERGRVASQQMDMDRRVIGFSGAASSMHYLTRFTEELLPAASSVAAKAKKDSPATGSKTATAEAPAAAGKLQTATAKPKTAAPKKTTLLQQPGFKR